MREDCAREEAIPLLLHSDKFSNCNRFVARYGYEILTQNMMMGLRLMSCVTSIVRAQLLPIVCCSSSRPHSVSDYDFYDCLMLAFFVSETSIIFIL